MGDNSIKSDQINKIAMTETTELKIIINIKVNFLNHIGSMPYFSIFSFFSQFSIPQMKRKPHSLTQRNFTNSSYKTFRESTESQVSLESKIQIKNLGQQVSIPQTLKKAS